ncbi:MAG TPA: hypothetical protein VK961_11700 [Chthoniobacter sp.]|nr:hypothetical protein [Chthoniobacter sp.]
MENTAQTKGSGLQLAIYWAIVSLPLFWGIWKTAIKLPALFQ